MNVTRTAIPDVLILEPRVFGDDRGFFFESFNEKTFHDATGLDVHFVQDNHSQSAKGVLRGLHYQLPPSAQGKLVRVVAGEVFDLTVDIRKGSPTFGQWVGEVLTAENKKQLWIPEGFAHAFLVLSDTAEFLYKTTNYYSPECERSILWDDKDLNIDWPLDAPPILSEKDKQANMFKDAEVF
jgi:dTDP-4-dehydrorhamnose 3,5-epimerase